MDNSEKVMKAFKDAGKPLKGGEVAELTGINKKEVDKIIKKLKTEDKLVSPKVCYYEPKK
jgi:biotin operon repressor